MKIQIKKKIKLMLILLAVFSIYYPSSAQAECSLCQAAASQSAKARQKKVQDLKEKMQGQHRFAHVYRATIESMGDDYLTISKKGQTYGVQIMGQTQLRRRFWGKSGLGEFNLGDVVSVFGRWVDQKQNEIEARVIKNLSIQRRWGAFFGTVQTVDTDNIVMTTIGRGDITVYIGLSKKFIDRNGNTILLSDIQPEHKIRAKGIWDKNQSEIRETEEVKDFSLPLLETTDE